MGLSLSPGLIRLFPAMPASWSDATFRLRTVGAFLVTGERRNGKTQPFLVESLEGAGCRFENPWPGERVSVRELASRRIVPAEKKESTMVFQTQPSEIYLVFPAMQPETLPKPVALRRSRSLTPKEWAGRRLGLPRYF